MEDHPMKRTISAVLCAALALTLAGCAEEKEPMLDRTVTVETTAAQTGRTEHREHLYRDHFRRGHRQRGLSGFRQCGGGHGLGG